MSKVPRSALIIFAAVIGCLLWCFLLAFDLVPSLRGDFGWRWPYALPEWSRMGVLFGTIAIYLAGAYRFRTLRFIRWWSFLGAVAIPLACLNVLGDPFYQLVTRTLSGEANGAHMAGIEITNLLDTLRNWPQLMPTYLDPTAHPMTSVHIALSPPGLPVLFYGATRLTSALPSIGAYLAQPIRLLQCQNFALMAYDNAQLASAWLGILMPIWAALSVFPIFRAGGKIAAFWWPLVPAISLFTPTWNTFYPLLAILAFGWLDYGLHRINSRPRRTAIMIISAGVLVSLNTFANISTVPLIGLLGLYSIFFWLRRWSKYPVSIREMTRQVVLVGVLFLIGLFSVWGINYLISGASPLAIISGALNQHLTLDRPYLPWVFLHLYDLAMFAGLPIVLIALFRLFPIFGVKRSSIGRHIDPLAMALGLTLVILALSGTARGETGRVWLFFVPFILIVAARYFDLGTYQTQSNHRWRFHSMITLTAAQVITLITLVAFVRVINVELTPPPDQPPMNVSVANLQPVAKAPTYANQITLTASHAVYQNDGVDLTLAWKVNQPPTVPYYVSALIVKPDGQPLGTAINWQPFETNYPMTCWRAGSQITETKHLTVGTDLPPGGYWISLSLFDPKDKQRANVTPTEQSGVPQDQYSFPAFTVH